MTRAASWPRPVPTPCSPRRSEPSPCPPRNERRCIGGHMKPSSSTRSMPSVKGFKQSWETSIGFGRRVDQDGKGRWWIPVRSPNLLCLPPHGAAQHQRMLGRFLVGALPAVTLQAHAERRGDIPAPSRPVGASVTSLVMTIESRLNR